MDMDKLPYTHQIVPAVVNSVAQVRDDELHLLSDTALESIKMLRYGWLYSSHDSLLQEAYIPR